MNVFSSIGIPHGFCYLWNPGLLWLHVCSDLMIAAAYFGIPFVLVTIVRRRKDIPFNWMLRCFAAFIVLCGITHVMEVVTLWHPVYWISGGLKAATAIISVVTLVLLIKLVPAIQAIPTAAELQRVNGQLTSVLESTTAGVYAIDKDWRIEYLNATARTMLEVRGDLIGRDFRDAFPGQQLFTRMQIESVMKTREAVDFNSYYAPLDISSTVHVHPWVNGGITVFFQDVSKQKRLERELDKERQLREQRIISLAQMAGGLAHEISNPLGIIHARASDLGEQASERPEISSATVLSATTSIASTADRAIRILRGLKMFSRQGSDDPKQPLQLETVIDQTVELVKNRFQKHDVDLQLTIANPLPQFFGRDVQISQILLNLLNNAVDAIDSAKCTERWVKVNATSETDRVMVEVIDSGPGISAENRAKLMQPFFTTKPAGSGLGIGLSLSKAIAEDHGGNLELTESAGHTCFRLSLPIHEERMPPSA